MDSYRRVRETTVTLRGTTVEELKRELEKELGRISIRQPKDTILISNKIPTGLAGFIKAGEELSGIVPFPIAGTLQDFMSFVPLDCNDLFVQITVIDAVGSQRVETRLMDGSRSYSIKAAVMANSFAKIKIFNKGQVDADCVVGFTFQEVKPNEIKATGINGSFENRTITGR
jgi:hypothetical protein